jgi:hypothetical protein
METPASSVNTWPERNSSERTVVESTPRSTLIQKDLPEHSNSGCALHRTDTYLRPGKTFLPLVSPNLAFQLGIFHGLLDGRDQNLLMAWQECLEGFEDGFVWCGVCCGLPAILDTVNFFIHYGCTGGAPQA